jgi:sporulation protein YlmC with PRC-barrel domain
MPDASQRMDLVYRVLDDQLVDVDGRRCGRADDLEFDGDLGEPPRLSTILSGKGVWHRRLPRPLRQLGARVFGKGVMGDDSIRVRWEDVEDVGTVITLRGRARDLGLGKGDDSAARRVKRLPDA